MGMQSFRGAGGQGAYVSLPGDHPADALGEHEHTPLAGETLTARAGQDRASDLGKSPGQHAPLVSPTDPLVRERIDEVREAPLVVSSLHRGLHCLWIAAGKSRSQRRISASMSAERG